MFETLKTILGFQSPPKVEAIFETIASKREELDAQRSKGLDHWEEATEKIDGIFKHKTKKGNDGMYYEKTLTFAEGVVESISDKPYHFLSGSSIDFIIGKDFSKSGEGSSLVLRDGEKSGVAEFPQSFSDIEKRSLIGTRVSYRGERSLFSEGALGDLIGHKYELEILDGPFKGAKFKKELTC